MGFRQVFTIGAFSFDQVRDSVRSEAVYAQIQPEFHHVQHFFSDRGVVIIQIRLRSVETVPVIQTRFLVISPVGFLGIDEDDTGIVVFFVGLRPDVKIRGIWIAGLSGRPGTRGAGQMCGSGQGLRLLLSRVDGFDDKAFEVFKGSIIRMNIVIICDVIAVVIKGDG